jgi:hypothetical protein
LQEASVAGALVLPPHNADIENVLAGQDPAHFQFCADISQGNSLVITSRQMDFIIPFIFNYYDLPNILKPEYCGDFRRAIIGDNPEMEKISLFRFTSARFAGKCRARSLFNLLQPNGSVLVPSDLMPVLESVVATFSDLADLRGNSDEQRRKRSNYYGVVLASLFAAVGKRRTNHISWKEFNNTNLADTIYTLAECTSSNDTFIFSRDPENTYLSDFERFRGNFAGLDVARILSYSSMNPSACQQCSITILERLLEDPLFSSHGEMHAAGFVWFNLIVQDQGKTTTSLGRWFKLLDINDDGYLDKHDLKHFFDGKLEQVIPATSSLSPYSFSCLLACLCLYQLQTNGAVHQPSFDEVWLQFQDIVPALRMKGRVMASDSGLLRAGGLLFDLFCAIDADNMVWRGHMC